MYFLFSESSSRPVGEEEYGEDKAHEQHDGHVEP